MHTASFDIPTRHVYMSTWSSLIHHPSHAWGASETSPRQGPWNSRMQEVRRNMWIPLLFESQKPFFLMDARAREGSEMRGIEHAWHPAIFLTQIWQHQSNLLHFSFFFPLFFPETILDFWGRYAPLSAAYGCLCRQCHISMLREKAGVNCSTIHAHV